MSTSAATCADCLVGSASGVGRGQFCPLIARSYSPGTVLFREGDKGDYVWYIKRGHVRLQRQGGGTSTTLTKRPGNFIGLESAVELPYRVTAVTVDESILCGATGDGFRQWMKGDEARVYTILRDVLDSLYPRTAQTTGD